MKILIPVLSFGNAGGYRVLSKLADELISLGNDITFICPDGSAAPYFPTTAKIQWIGKEGLLYGDYIHKPASVENFFTIQQKLKKAFRKIDIDSYDAILANHSLTVIPLARCGLLHKTIYYVQAYEPELYFLTGGIKNYILGMLSALSYRKNLYTVVNSEIYRHYKKLHSSKLLYPGIDFTLFYPGENSSDKGEKIIIGTVGRLERYKGTGYVLDAFKILKKKYPHAELHVAFGNPADFIGCQGVYCLKPENDKQLGDYYRSLNYYFCAGFTQPGAFHYPVAEAMSCGIPVISTLYYPVNAENVWLTEPYDARDIVDKFEQAYTNPVLRNAKKKKAFEDTRRFAWKETGKKLQGYFTELVNGPGYRKLR
jgi:glycosyltransferase involved in cell wall biosynthesis